MAKKVIKKKFWVIEGWNSTQRIFHIKYPLHSISEKRIIQILQVLTAKYSLSDEEIWSYFIKKNSLLDVRKEANQQTYAFHCGSNPYFIANLIQEHKDK